MSFTSKSVAEYTYSTDPSWVSDAIVCTKTGLELNFNKLSLLCLGGDIPSRISINLVASNLSKKNSLGNSCNDEHFMIKSGLPVHSLSRQDAGNTKVDSSIDIKQVIPDSKLSRQESIIDREIRLQKEREHELQQEREKSRQSDAKKSPSPAPSTQSAASNGVKANFVSEHPMKAEISKAQEREEELKRQRTISQTKSPIPNGSHTEYKSPAPLSPPVSISVSAQQPATRTPSVISVKSTTRYAHESPIARDIRITREREEEHLRNSAQN